MTTHYTTETSMSFEKLPKFTFWRAVLLVILSAGFYSTPASFHERVGGRYPSDGPLPLGLVDWL